MPKVKWKKRKDGRYQASVTIGFDDNGKRIRKYVYSRDPYEIDDVYSEARTKANENQLSIRPNITFKEYADNWLENKSVGIERATITMYKIVIETHCKKLHDTKMNKVTKDNIMNIIKDNVDKPRTCQKIKITLNQIMDHAQDDNVISKNPCKRIEIPKYKAKKKRCLTPGELFLSDSTTFTDREKCFIKLIKNCGLRKEEALAMRKQYVDLDNMVIKVRNAIYFENNQPVIKGLKTKSSERDLPIIEDDKEFYEHYLNKCDDYLFLSLSTGTLISEQSFKRMWESIKTKMKNKAKKDEIVSIESDLTPHIYRHNFCSMLHKAGISIKVAQYLMGHSSIKVTMDIYTHLDEDSISTNRDIASKLESYLKK